MKSSIKESFGNRAIALVIALTLIFSLTPIVSAESIQTAHSTESAISFVPMSDNSYKEQLIKSLGMSSVEAKRCNFYITDIPVSSQNITLQGIQIPSNTTHYWPEFTFYQSNHGAYWTANAQKFQWGIAYFNSPNDPDNYDLRLNVVLESYGESGAKDQAWVHTGSYVYSSNWINVNWGSHDYRFHYYCSYLTDPRIYGTATVRMYLITSNNL